MPREIALVSAEPVDLIDVLAAAVGVDYRLAPREVLGGWALQLVDRDDVVVLTVEQSRRLMGTGDVARILGEEAEPGALWWTEATAPCERAGEVGVRVARAIARRLSAQIRVAEDDVGRPGG